MGAREKKIYIVLWILGVVGISVIIGILLFAFDQNATRTAIYTNSRVRFWPVESIDTAKYSRDLAREKLYSSSFDAVIDEQVRAIAATGATHVSINTPYDEEFVPYLERWVRAARTYGLGVWFRGNWAGWEGWFDYPKISRDAHIQKTKDFILKHRDLFQDGDIFTACPECENGGPGDPRHNGDVVGHRAFLIKEYEMTKDSFLRIGKNVTSNYDSMNGDVARLVMDKQTTAALGGIVTVDHYVKSPEQFAKDLTYIAEKSGGKIIVGEFGAPIPDIHGGMSGVAQAVWIESALKALAKVPAVEGVNYWVNVGGSTEIWTSSFAARPAVGVITDFYRPRKVYGFVKDELDRPLKDANVKTAFRETKTDRYGYFEIPYYPKDDLSIEFSANGYLSEKDSIQKPDQLFTTTLAKEQRGYWYRFLVFLKSL